MLYQFFVIFQNEVLIKSHVANNLRSTDTDTKLDTTQTVTRRHR